jgi:O-antigen/teichoic acid export membrane protein
MLAAMHFILIVLRYLSKKFEDNKFTTWRIISNFIASVAQLTVIIISIGLYVNAFRPTKNEDGTVS